MEKSVLVVLDTQVNMFDEEFSVHDPEGILSRLEGLISSAKRAKVPLIYVRNNGSEGDPDEPGTPGWELHPRIKPVTEGVVIDKVSPDAFDGTVLEDHLQRLGVKELVIAGMQTEMCVRSTCLSALDRGFDVTLVEDAHTTFDFDEQSAVEAIEGLNKELRSIANVKPASQITF
ncbi:MAG: cysteine hydrolase family protein [Anaerolineales bacterium]